MSLNSTKKIGVMKGFFFLLFSFSLNYRVEVRYFTFRLGPELSETEDGIRELEGREQSIS